jgi:hypothetical protein
MHVVAKPFNTTLQRFRLGAPVAPSDDLSPHTREDLEARGFIKQPAAAEASAAAPAAPAVKRK